jgi:succinyl-diaminopimelate desuccinylase
LVHRSFREAPRLTFGEAPESAGRALDIFRLRFSAKNHNGYVGTADLTACPQVDILGHLDEVGEGTGWDTDPFTAT